MGPVRWRLGATTCGTGSGYLDGLLNRVRLFSRVVVREHVVGLEEKMKVVIVWYGARVLHMVVDLQVAFLCTCWGGLLGQSRTGENQYSVEKFIRFHRRICNTYIVASRLWKIEKAVISSHYLVETCHKVQIAED
jgi:hypothetical protein